MSSNRESEPDRWQRNYEELLQELRVAQTGVQILFAFLLAILFAERFPVEDTFAQTVHLVALLSAAASTALLIAPVAYHRALFRRGEKPRIARSTHRLANGGLAMTLVSMVASVLLATDMVLDRPWAWLLAAATAGWFGLLWGFLPLRRRHTAANDKSPDTERTSGV